MKISRTSLIAVFASVAGFASMSAFAEEHCSAKVYCGRGSGSLEGQEIRCHVRGQHCNAVENANWSVSCSAWDDIGHRHISSRDCDGGGGEVDDNG